MDINSLILALQNKDSYIRKNAAQILIQHGWQPKQDRIGAYFHMTQQNWQQCVKLGILAVKPLILALQDEASYVRQAAATALGEIGDQRAVAPLIMALQDKQPNVRCTVSIALATIGNPDAIKSLLHVAIVDSEANVRQTAQAACHALLHYVK